MIVDRTRGGKWRTVYRINICPMEEHSPNWTAYYTVTPPPFTHPETLLVLKEETQTRDQLARENRRNERHADSVHVQHLLQAESRGLKTGDHDVLLHAANAVHA